jgi:hypothetical protein
MQDENKIYLPVHPVWGTALAVLDGEPVWPQLGAADDDDNEPEIDLDATDGSTAGTGQQRDFLDDEPDDDDEPEGEPAGTAPTKTADAKPKVVEEKKPERTAADWDRLEAAMQNERTLRKKREGQIAEMRKERKAAEATGDTEEADKIRKAEESAAARYKPVAVRAAAKAALLEANFQNPTEERVKKLIRRLDLEEIDVDDDGDITGLQDQIDQLVDDFPELFTTPAAPTAPAAPATKKPPRVSTSNKPPVTQKEYKTTGEKIAAQITSVGQS